MPQTNSQPISAASSTSGLKRSIKANSRLVVTAMIALTIAICAFYFVRTQNQLARVNLYEGLSLTETDQSEIQIALSKAGLNDFEFLDGEVFVPRKSRDLYIKAIAEYDAVPGGLDSHRPKQQQFSPWQSQMEKELANQQDRIERLTSLLNRLKFVEQAWIEFDEVQVGGLSRETHRTAMVVVKKKNQQFLNDLEIVTVREMLNGAVADLKDDCIVITDLNASIPYSSSNYPDDAQLRNRIAQQIERNTLQQDLTNALAHFQGLRVRVNPIDSPSSSTSNQDISKQKMGNHDSQRDLHSGEAVPVGKHEEKTNALAAGANRPFKLKKFSAKPAMGSVASNSSPAEKQPNDGRQKAGGQQIDGNQQHGIQWVSVDFVVPNPLLDRFVEKYGVGQNDARQQGLDSLGQQIQQVADVVLANRRIKTVGLNVVIQPVEDSSSADAMVMSAIPWETMRSWAKTNWVTLTLIAIGVVAIVFITVKWQPTNRSRAGSNSSAVPQGTSVSPSTPSNNSIRVHPGSSSAGSSHSINNPAKMQGAATSPSNGPGTGPRTSDPQNQMKAEIAEMIKSDPRKAAEILKSWMKDAA